MLRHDVQILTLIGVSAACGLALTSIFLSRIADIERTDRVESREIIVLEVAQKTSGVMGEHAFEWRESKPVVLRSGPEVTWKRWRPKPSFRIETREFSPPSVVGLRYLWEKPFWNPWRSETGPLDFEFRFQPSR